MGQRFIEAPLLLERDRQVGFGDRPHHRLRQDRPVGEKRGKPHGCEGRHLAARRARQDEPPSGHDSSRCEEHQERHQRKAIAGEHVEHDDAGRVSERHDVQDPEPASFWPRHEGAEERQRRQNPEIAEPGAEAKWSRPLRVAFLALGVERLVGVPQQDELLSDELQPGARLRRDEAHRPVPPVDRDLRRRQRPSHRVFGQIGGVLPLVLGSPATVTQRHVRAVGTRVVPDIEVWPELRRRQIESAADRMVADRHGRQDDRKAEQKRDGFDELRWPLPDQRPQQNHPDQHDRVFTREAEAAHRKSEPQPRQTSARTRVALRPASRGRRNQSAQQPESKADEEDVEHRLLDQPVEEDRGRVQREGKPCDEARAP